MEFGLSLDKGLLILWSFWLVESLVQTVTFKLEWMNEWMNESHASCLPSQHFSFLLYICPQIFDFLTLHCYSVVPNEYIETGLKHLSPDFLFQCFSMCFFSDTALFSLLCCCRNVIFSGYGMLWCFSILKRNVCAGLSRESSAWQPVSYTLSHHWCSCFNKTMNKLIDS